MKSLILLIGLFLIQTFVSAQETIHGTIVHDNFERSYILYVPASYNAETSVPLLFSFHGFGSTADVNFAYTNFTKIADTAGFIVVHPQGTLLLDEPHWNVGGWTLASTTDDIGFTDALLESISNTYNIDPKRIYSTGMSNGGYMSFLLACQLSDKFAAIASVTGSMTIQTYDDCNPTHPTPILQIHGTSDLTVPYNGNISWTRSIDDVLSYWANYNHCNALPTITNIPNINTSDGSTVQHYLYGDGDDGVTTEHFKIIGGAHTWPGIWGNFDINASLEVWKFLSRYNINGLIKPVGLPEIIETKPDFSLHPNPSSSYVFIKRDISKPVEFELTNTFGQIVLKGKTNTKEQRVDLQSLSADVYFMKIGDQVQKLIITE